MGILILGQELIRLIILKQRSDDESEKQKGGKPMSQAIYTYIFFLVLIFIAGLFTGRLIEVRVRREYYLRKYGSGTVERETLQKLLRPHLLIVSASATALSCAALIYALYRNTNAQNFVFALVFVSAVVVLGLATVPRLVSSGEFRKKDNRA